MKEKIIEVKNLVKTYRINERKHGILGYVKNLFHPRYKEYTAVNGISFAIDEGELVGYIGENGAGKSTTIKMLTGLLTPTSGSVVVNGIVPNEKRIQNNKQIGAVFGQKTQLWWDLPVIETFELIKKMYDMSEEEYQKNLEEFSDILELKPLLEKQVKNLSLGQKMRCEIAATFLHNPKIVYLDEPTIGLDILVKENIRKFLKDINQKYHTTIILTTHDLKDIEEVCDKIILIDKGKIIYDGGKEDFKAQYGKYVMGEFIIQDKIENITLATSEEEFEVINETEKKLQVRFNHDKVTIIDVVNQIAKYCKIVDMHVQEQGLEEILKEIYRGEIISDS